MSKVTISQILRRVDHKIRGIMYARELNKPRMDEAKVETEQNRIMVKANKILKKNGIEYDFNRYYVKSSPTFIKYRQEIEAYNTETKKMESNFKIIREKIADKLVFEGMNADILALIESIK